MGQLIFRWFEVTKIQQTEEKVDVQVQVRSEECCTAFLLVGLITVFPCFRCLLCTFFMLRSHQRHRHRDKKTCRVARCACTSVRFAGGLRWNVAHSGQKVELASASRAAGFYRHADCCENCRRKKEKNEKKNGGGSLTLEQHCFFPPQGLIWCKCSHGPVASSVYGDVCGHITLVSAPRR